MSTERSTFSGPARRPECRRVVYAASSSAYGDTEVLPKVETMLPRPKSPYAVQKLLGEYYARVFHSSFGLETVSLRFFNVYGERQDPSSPYSGVLSLFMRALIERHSPVIFGDGEQTRDFTYVEDVVGLCLKASTATGVGGKMYNAGNGGRYSLNHIWKVLRNDRRSFASAQLCTAARRRRARFPGRYHCGAAGSGARSAVYVGTGAAPDASLVSRVMLSIIRDTIRKIPKSKVATYGDVAKAAGFPGCARQVVWALRGGARSAVASGAGSRRQDPVAGRIRAGAAAAPGNRRRGVPRRPRLDGKAPAQISQASASNHRNGTEPRPQGSAYHDLATASLRSRLGIGDSESQCSDVHSARAVS